MIHITSVYDARLKTVQPENILAIVRSNKRLPSGVCWVSELSPSWELFQQYLRWRDAGMWNPETFEKSYVPRFISELQSSEEALKLLAAIKYVEEQGRELWLVCFCKEESLCHRSIIAGILQGLGVKVDAPDYSKYFKLFAGDHEQHL